MKLQVILLDWKWPGMKEKEREGGRTAPPPPMDQGVKTFSINFYA